jgi:hypothetical protein
MNNNIKTGKTIPFLKKDMKWDGAKENSLVNIRNPKIFGILGINH